MSQEKGSISENPFFQNAFTLDLSAWEVISRKEADRLFLDPWKEAERIEKTSLRAVLEARVRFWEQEFSSSDSRVARRWPHTVFPPLEPEASR